jgi:F-type H+-transporting ATPase subunit b
MFFLVDFSVIKPDFGLLFWTTITFLILWGLLGKLAWKPIQSALKDRENSIDDALKQAEKAREEMAALNAQNEALLASAREERSRILQEAKVMSDNIVRDAKDKAKVEADKIVVNAQQEINRERKAAITEVKNTAGRLALEVAEKVIRQQLVGNVAQEAYAAKLVEEIELN